MSDGTKHECDVCDGYYFGTWADAQKDERYVKHMQRGKEIVLCGACETRFAERRKASAELAGQVA